MNINLSHLTWCRSTFSLLKDGGCWAVPRSGLIFTRRGQELVWTARMPHDPAMSITPEQLKEQQDSEYAINKLNFEAAGIPMKDEAP